MPERIGGRGWRAWLVLGIGGLGCQAPLIVEDGDGSDGTAVGTSTEAPDDPPVVSTSTTTVDPVTTGPVDPTTADDTTTGDPPIPETCDLLAQDCPPGYKCTPFIDPELGNSFNVRCVEVADDPLPPHSPCTVSRWPPDGNDDCDATSFCFDIDPDTLQGTCTAYCIGTREDPHCAEPCEFCALSGDGALLPCIATCDPLGNDCAKGQGCYPVQDSFVCARENQPVGVGEACEFINVCMSGTACLSGNAVPGCMAPGCCSPYCDPAAAFDPCPKILPGSVCTPWYEPGQEPQSECPHDPPGVCAAP